MKRSTILEYWHQCKTQKKPDFVKIQGGLRNQEKVFELALILKKKRGNFIFVKDITTHQRTLLYNMLESKGFKRRELFRHYSY